MSETPPPPEPVPRGARDLGPDDLVWDFFSRPRQESMRARVRPAADAGFAAIGMYLASWVDLRDDHRELALFEEELDEHGLVVANIETLRGWAAPDGPDERCLAMEAMAWEIAERFECRYLQIVGDFEGTVGQAAAGFGSLCDRAADHGLLVGLEAVPSMTNIGTLGLARRIIQEADRPNGGLCFDSWHLTRSGDAIAELAEFEPRQIVATQWNDGTLQPTLDDYYTDTLTTRLPPGDGEFALVDMVRALRELGSRAPTGIEVPSTALWALPAHEAARLCAEGMRQVWARAGA